MRAQSRLHHVFTSVRPWGCDARKWANGAFAFPMNLVVGWVGPLRRGRPPSQLDKFIGDNPTLGTLATDAAKKPRDCA
jgi:hypothetical protein